MPKASFFAEGHCLRGTDQFRHLWRLFYQIIQGLSFDVLALPSDPSAFLIPCIISIIIEEEEGYRSRYLSLCTLFTMAAFSISIDGDSSISEDQSTCLRRERG
jgi:hypothetical protein